MTYSHNHDDIVRYQELLGQVNAHVDGELAAELCHDLELHLADCADCRVVFDTLAKTITLYQPSSKQRARDHHSAQSETPI